jgi:hypothetical protein
MLNIDSNKIKIKSWTSLKVVKANIEQKLKLCSRQCDDGTVSIYSKEKQWCKKSLKNCNSKWLSTLICRLFWAGLDPDGWLLYKC